MKCKDCKWWNKMKREIPMGIGACHRKAPQKTGIAVLAGELWPQTNHYDWCGEFEARENETQS